MLTRVRRACKLGSLAGTSNWEGLVADDNEPIDTPNPDAGKATLVYELCCAVCEDYEHLVRPLRDHAEDAGWERIDGLGWVHSRCLLATATEAAL